MTVVTVAVRSINSRKHARTVVTDCNANERTRSESIYEITNTRRLCYSTFYVSCARAAA